MRSELSYLLFGCLFGFKFFSFLTVPNSEFWFFSIPWSYIIYCYSFSSFVYFRVLSKCLSGGTDFIEDHRNMKC